MMAPRNAGLHQPERRQTLLQRRADMLPMVVSEEALLPEELQVCPQMPY